MLETWLRLSAAPVSLSIALVLTAASPQEVREVEREGAALARDVAPRVQAVRTVTPRSADDLFRRLPAALEDRDDRALRLLLAPVEVAIALEPRDTGQEGRRLGPDQAFYILREFFDPAHLSREHRLGLSGYASPSGKIVCVPGDDDAGDRRHAILHLIADRGDGATHERIWVEARRYTVGAPVTHGWRVAELRILD